jgi:hypothetical protein
VGVLAGSFLTYQQTMRTQDNDYRLHFASTIKDATPGLSSEKTAAITYASLYALANNSDRDFKRILMIIGYATQSSSVKSVLAEFIGADKDMQDIAVDPKMIAIAQSAATVSANASGQTVAAKLPANSAEAAAAQAKATPDAGQIALLSAAVPKSARSAWVYYGRIGSAGSGSGECVDPKVSVPKIGSTLTLCGSRYVRDLPTAINSRVITALGAGSQVRVVGQRVVPLSKDARAVWLRIDPP